jgi:sterol desaturase/sphingolipid hydroxylase (fatty acid hydroxylase superfamily)
VDNNYPVALGRFAGALHRMLTFWVTLMPHTVLPAEPLIRLGAFLGVFIFMALWEALAPRRSQTIGRWTRWPNNLGIVVIDTVVVRVLFPAATVGIAMVAEEHRWGFFNAVPVPRWAALAASVVLLDFTIYTQHVAFHAIPMLWRLHRMHHADLEFDVTTGVRFHPVEIVLSMLIKFAVVLAIGTPALAVLTFEVFLNATSMFNHGNVRLSARIEHILRLVVVTPEMHRVHHSILRRETDSNFGFNLSWWDRLFGTYRAQPEAGHEQMIIGIDRFRDPAELRLDRMLLQPLRNDPPAHRQGENTRPPFLT